MHIHPVFPSLPAEDSVLIRRVVGLRWPGKLAVGGGNAPCPKACVYNTGVNPSSSPACNAPAYLLFPQPCTLQGGAGGQASLTPGTAVWGEWPGPLPLQQVVCVACSRLCSGFLDASNGG
jgi:hypothetical protein